MKKLNKRETIILIICLGLLLVFAVRQFIIVPLWERAGNIDSQIRVSQARLNKARQTLLLRDSVKEHYQKLVRLIGTAGSDAQEMSAMVDKVQAAANRAGVHVANIQPQKALNKEPVSFFPVELEISGQWKNIIQFIHALQSSPNYYFLSDLLLEKNADPRGVINGRFTIFGMKLINS